MAAETQEALKERLHDLIADLVGLLDVSDLVEEDCLDSSVCLEGIDNDTDGSILSVDLSFHVLSFMPLEELLEATASDAPHEVEEVRTILEEFKNLPAPAPSKKASRRS